MSSHYLLDFEVRNDWRAQAQVAAAARVRRWRATTLAITATVFAALLINLLLPASSFRSLAFSLLITAVLWLLTLFFALPAPSRNPASIAHRVAGPLIVLTACAIAFISSPQVVTFIGAPVLSLLALVIPISTWSILALLGRYFPRPSRQLGLNWSYWPRDLVVGAAVGLALGFHFLLTSRAMPSLTGMQGLSATSALWFACVMIGLISLGTELFFRGWCYHLLVDCAPCNAFGGTVRITLLNVLVMVTLAADMLAVINVIWLIIYCVALSLVVVALRYRMHSVLPALACNVVVSLFLSVFLMT